MDYNKLLEKARKMYSECVTGAEKRRLESLFPELAESEDERIRKEIINYFKCQSRDEPSRKAIHNIWLAWLEKQGNNDVVKGILRGAAIDLIVWIDYNAAKGNMCLSNMECEDIEDALVGGNWDKIYAYIKKKLLKQGEKQDYNPYKTTIESIAAMVEKYANGDLKDFYNNIKVKCKDAMEYDKTWNKEKGE